jgi:DNA-binding response OmpR family regulator
MNKPIILVCDDSDVILHLVAFALQAQGFEVIAAGSTDEIYLKMESSKPTLILLDLNIPLAGGAAVLEKLKTNTETNQIPVVLFSGENKLQEIAEELKADGFLQKPFDVNELVNVVRKFISRTESQ